MKMNFPVLTKGFVLVLFSALNFTNSNAQTNVFDDIISQSPNHTYLTAAINQEGLAGALQDASATLTVFAPTNAAFDDLAASMDTDIPGLLDLPNLSEVLLYHVLGITAPSTALANGLTVTPLNTANTIKLSVLPNGVFANHAKVTTPDLTADNGVVHVTDKVILPNFTVVDIALNNTGFEILTTAVIAKGFLPVLTDPFAEFTVLAPNDAAFTALLDALDITAEQLLASPILNDVLLYHVLDSEVEAADLENGMLPTPINDDNTLKVTINNNGLVFFNQAQVIVPDLTASNGVVHALNSVLLPNKTVVDVAIDNGFTYLTTALIQEKLLPVLTNPFGNFTVFAPTNAAFDILAEDLNTNIAGILALNNLTDVLLYHVAPEVLASTDLENGPLTMASGSQATINLVGGVTINQAAVTTANIEAFNGIVHVIDQVILPATASVEQFGEVKVVAYPNPTTGFLKLDGVANAQLRFVDLNGSEVYTANYDGSPLNINGLSSGLYFIYISTEQKEHVVRLSIK